MGSKSELIIGLKAEKNLDIIGAFREKENRLLREGGHEPLRHHLFGLKSSLIISQKRQNNLSYYRHVLRKNRFSEGGVEKILHIIRAF